MFYWQCAIRKTCLFSIVRHSEALIALAWGHFKSSFYIHRVPLGTFDTQAKLARLGRYIHITLWYISNNKTTTLRLKIMINSVIKFQPYLHLWWSTWQKILSRSSHNQLQTLQSVHYLKIVSLQGRVCYSTGRSWGPSGYHHCRWSHCPAGIRYDSPGRCPKCSSSPSFPLPLWCASNSMHPRGSCGGGWGWRIFHWRL